MSDLRKVEVLFRGQWIQIDFNQLKKGDIFRLYEPDGTPVTDVYGNQDLEAVSDPYINEDGIWAIEIKDNPRT